MVTHVNKSIFFLQETKHFMGAGGLVSKSMVTMSKNDSYVLLVVIYLTIRYSPSKKYGSHLKHLCIWGSRTDLEDLDLYDNGIGQTKVDLSNLGSTTTV